MKTSMVARGKAVRSAVSSGHHEMTKGMRKTRSIGQDIERWWKVNEVQIPGTKDALYRALLDSLGQLFQLLPGFGHLGIFAQPLEKVE